MSGCFICQLSSIIFYHLLFVHFTLLWGSSLHSAAPVTSPTLAPLPSWSERKEERQGRGLNEECKRCQPTNKCDYVFQNASSVLTYVDSYRNQGSCSQLASPPASQPATTTTTPSPVSQTDRLNRLNQPETKPTVIPCFIYLSHFTLSSAPWDVMLLRVAWHSTKMREPDGPGPGFLYDANRSEQKVTGARPPFLSWRCGRH